MTFFRIVPFFVNGTKFEQTQQIKAFYLDFWWRLVMLKNRKILRRLSFFGGLQNLVPAYLTCKLCICWEGTPGSRCAFQYDYEIMSLVLNFGFLDEIKAVRGNFILTHITSNLEIICKWNARKPLHLSSYKRHVRCFTILNFIKYLIYLFKSKIKNL